MHTRATQSPRWERVARPPAPQAAGGRGPAIRQFLLFFFVRQLRQYDRERSVQQRALLDERSRLETEVTRRTARLAAVAKHLQTAREDERASLARELHDELGGLLTASKLDLARARKRRASLQNCSPPWGASTDT